MEGPECLYRFRARERWVSEKYSDLGQPGHPPGGHAFDTKRSALPSIFQCVAFFSRGAGLDYFMLLRFRQNGVFFEFH